jgi:antitoxin (DNA-binding transcriptional repressor) of toxin-antitoxin stability system
MLIRACPSPIIMDITQKYGYNFSKELNHGQLVDKALAGEEVVITRHGKPTVALTLVKADSPEIDMEKRRIWMERLDAFRATMPKPKHSYLELKRMEQDEWESRFDR